MLLVEFEHTIDDKNRLTLPAKFRQALSGGLVITRGMDGCLYCYPKTGWERLVESRLADLDPLSREGRLMHRFFFAGAAEAEPDKQGRVMLPATLAKNAGIDREVVVAGVNDHPILRSTLVIEQHVKVLEGSAEDVAERLASQRD